MFNPFKFGAVATSEFFTDRVAETKEISRALRSGNHLVLISPRRYGKTSLIQKVLEKQTRPSVYLDMQLATGVADMATQLMKRVLKISKWENIKRIISDFRIVPTIELNPSTGGMDVTFRPSVSDSFTPLEDVLGLIEKIGEKGRRPIVVLDEFQEVTSLDNDLPKQLRSVIQHHANVNYIFLGSAESMMRRIFETKKSPFYHFGLLMTLGRIPYDDFYDYLSTRFAQVTDKAETVSKELLAFTDMHPYYTQQLAYYCYDFLDEEKYRENMIEDVIGRIVEVHGNDYERLWITTKKTDKRILITLAEGRDLSSVTQPTSTVYSGLKRLAEQGYVVRNGSYRLDDPFFGRWITNKRGL
jgi:AAA+ ATPase superfamily predicted ATPase